jgi:hypothetical protein
MKRNSALILFCSVLLAAHAHAQVKLKDITDKVSNLACDNSNQCKSIGVGKRQCGGPDGYVTYSIKTVNESELETLVNQYNNSITFPPGSSGICVVPNTPIAACIASQCSADETTPTAHKEGDAVVIDLPAVVYYEGLNDAISAEGFSKPDISGKAVYKARLVSYKDEKDGSLKFRVEWIWKNE